MNPLHLHRLHHHHQVTLFCYHTQFVSKSKQQYLRVLHSQPVPDSDLDIHTPAVCVCVLVFIIYLFISLVGHLIYPSRDNCVHVGFTLSAATATSGGQRCRRRRRWLDLATFPRPECGGARWQSDGVLGAQCPAAAARRRQWQRHDGERTNATASRLDALAAAQ